MPAGARVWLLWKDMSLNQRVLGSSHSAPTNPFKGLEEQGAAYLPRKYDWEEYGKARQALIGRCQEGCPSDSR